MKRYCFTSYSFFALLGLILSPLSVVYAQPSPDDSVPKCAPFDYEQWRRDHPRPASKRLVDLDVGEPRTVRMIYFSPNDRPYRAGAVDTMKTRMRQAQDFFTGQMEAHGYGNTTWRFEADAQGEPLVLRVDGKHPTDYYNTDRTVGKVFEEIDPVFDIEENVYYVAIDNGNSCFFSADKLVGGVGGRWGKNGGWGLVPIRADFGTVAHELGHAFGLAHDFRDDAYVMSYGFAPDWLLANHRLSACNAEFLAVHPYFNPNSPIEDGSWPIINEHTSSPIQTEGIASLPVRINVRDSNGLHQAILFTITQDPHFAAGFLEVKACRGVEGKINSVVEFDYDGTVPSMPESDFNAFETQELVIGVLDALGDATWSDKIELVNNEFRGPIATFLSSKDRLVVSMFFSSDGRLLALDSDTYSNLDDYLNSDSRVKLWDVSRGKSIATFPNRGYVYADLSPDGRLLALGSTDGTIKLWNVSSGEVHVAIVSAHEESESDVTISSLSFSPDGKLLASYGTEDRLVKLWDVASGKHVATFQSQDAPAAFSPDGTLLATASGGGAVALWDVANRERVAQIDAHESGAGSWQHNIVAFSPDPDGRLLATGGRRWVSVDAEEDSEVKLWDVASGKRVAILFGGAPVAFSPDGRLLATVSAYKTRWVDLDGLEGGTRRGNSSGGQAIRLWDVSMGEPIATLPPWSQVQGVAFSPDGTLLAEASHHAVRLWDVSEWAGEVTRTAGEQAMPHTLTKVSGDGQEGTVGEPLAKPFVVSVLDQNGSAFAGAVVTFSVTAGGGTLSSTTATTNANGRARSTLTLGDDPETNTVTAAVAGLEPVTFTAIGQATTDSDGEEDDGEIADGDNDAAVDPQARLTPDPAEVEFYADDPAWKTFTVHTNLDSVLVHANPSGSDPAIEVEGGPRPPTRAYCPAEGNDRPKRGRQDGWSLHVKACQAGQTKILLKDYDTGAVVQQYEVNVEASTSAAASTALNPSYPNPFNSETILSYTLPIASDIRLEVFTLNGQRVAVLHEGFQAAGYHTIALDASDLASGVYLYRLTTPEGRFVQKFTLLR